MASSTVLENVLIKYKGPFEFEVFYKEMMKWFEERGYVVIEKIYKDKAASPFGHEVEWTFEPEKEVTQYVKYEVSLFFQFWDVKEVEVEKNGEKKRITEGKAKLKILSAKVSYDWQGNFGGGWKEKAKNVMHKLLKMYFAVRYEDPLYQEMKSFQNMLKNKLGMNTV